MQNTVNPIDSATHSQPIISAIILAAGLSKRMGEANKLLLDFQNQPMVRTVVSIYMQSLIHEVIVVAGYQHEAIAQALSGCKVTVAVNPDFEQGMASSIGVGVRSAHPSAQGYLIALGDMPMVQPRTIQQVCQVFAQRPGRSIVVPRYQGRRGHPVLFGCAFNQNLQNLRGDSGARRILVHHSLAVREVAVEDPGIHRDIDSRREYQNLGRTFPSTGQTHTGW